MKILYLDLNIQYQNPTRNNYLLILKSLGRVDIYGPGYQPEDVLEQGVEKFYDNYGPFDFVVSNEHIVFGSQKIFEHTEVTINSYKTNYYLQFNTSKLQKHMLDMFNFFKKVYVSKLTFLLESDYYNFQKDKIERLLSCNTFIIGWGDEFILPLKKLEDLKKESFSANANDNWFNFVNNYDNIIQFPHFVHSAEFYFETLFNRQHTIYVAGTNYYHRKMVNNLLNKSPYKVDNFKLYNKIFSVMRKLKLKPDSHPILMPLYKTLFKNKLESTKYVFTCGSGLQWPIRKFFEIPASGALLFAKPFHNAHKMGFIDNETFIDVDYSKILDKIAFLEKNQKVAQSIAKKGQEMVWKSHSIQARVVQLESSLDAIVKNKFKGTYWENGEFYVR